MDDPSATTSALAKLVAAGAILLGLSGCSNVGQYLDRRDTVTFGAGDAVRANVVAQVIDPWPARVWDQNIVYEGEHMGRVIRRYQTAPSRQQGTGRPPVGIVVGGGTTGTGTGGGSDTGGAGGDTGGTSGTGSNAP